MAAVKRHKQTPPVGQRTDVAVIQALRSASRDHSKRRSAERLGAAAETAVVLGDSIWDMLAAKRCKALGVGLLSGDHGSRELQDAGAIRVYEDPAEVLGHIDEIGGRR